MSLLFQRVDIQVKPEHQQDIFDFAFDHLSTFGALPVDVSIPESGDSAGTERQLDFDQYLSALSEVQLQALFDKYCEMEKIV